MKDNLIKDKSFEFALHIIEFYKELKEQQEYIISKQLLRSGTSIGANIQESTAAVSIKDFCHKLTISSKEARETRYRLQLLEKSTLVHSDKIITLLEELEDIINILTKIIKTTQEKYKI